MPGGQMSDPGDNSEEIHSESEYEPSAEDSATGHQLTLMVPSYIVDLRLDKILRDLHPDLSRAQWQRLLRQGQVLIDGQAARANYKVKGGEQIIAVIPPPIDTDLIPENIPLNIVYEDDDMLAIDKPAGIVMHPAVGHPTGTIANAVVYHYPDVLDVGGERRPGLVHRLDKDTSGVVLIAKNDRALNHLVDQFKERTIKKVYLALVEGQIKPEKALIDAPLGRNPADRKRMAVIQPGKNLIAQASQTRYEATEYFDQHSLVTCYPITGRTHQIRVHLAYINYPIVGDRIYGHRKQTLPLKRHFLHAHQIHFRRPHDNEPIDLTVPLPAELQTILDQLHV